MPVSQMEPAEFDRVMATNFNALQYQLYAFHDLLRASMPGGLWRSPAARPWPASLLGALRHGKSGDGAVAELRHGG